ncbi:MAG: HAMP domain-containing histidine kinase [Oscillospiraceae bacterium]|nr:HAMP domain-containing histidine kinase [Oscillospiraceae bacterium]
MKNKKRVKPYIVIPIYAAVIALLTKMVSTCTDQYIDNRIYDQQINNMNYSVSQIQKYSYKYEEQPLEEAISSLRTTMGRDVANSVYLPGMDLFFTMFYRIPSGLRNITWFPENLYFSKMTGNIHGVAILVDEERNVLASNLSTRQAVMYFEDFTGSDDDNYFCYDSPETLNVINEYYENNKDLLKPEKDKSMIFPELVLDSAYVNRKTHEFIMKQITFSWIKLNYDGYGYTSRYGYTSYGVEETEPIRKDTIILPVDEDTSDFKLYEFSDTDSQKWPYCRLTNYFGESQEIIDSTEKVACDLYGYGGVVSVDDRTGDDGTVFSLRNIPLKIDGKNCIISLRYFYDPDDPYIKNVKKKWTISIAVLLSIIGLIMLIIRYFRLKSAYRLEDYQRDLTNHLAHDIKTPLMAIGGYTENLLEGDMTAEEQKRYLDSILSNISFTDSIINRTLYLNQIEKIRVRKEMTDLRALIESAFEKYRLMLEEKQITFEVTGEATIKTKRDQIEMLIENLISNAVKYTPEQGNISVLVTPKSITVKNSVSEKLRTRKLKQPFVRGDKARSNVKGTGLGLSIADRAAAATGFRLKLSCSGSEFKATARKKLLTLK